MQPKRADLIYGNSEDCLSLNIFVPTGMEEEIIFSVVQSPRIRFFPKVHGGDAKKAVIFHIHGGAYFEGSGDDEICGPDFLIEHDVIVVTVNYRLGALGFLNLNTREISGNMGLKDQQMALIWIYANVERFGGDQSRITVSGHSAGSSSSHYQALNADSVKHFNRHISMSGAAIANFALTRDSYIDKLHTIAGTHQVTDLIQFLMELPGEQLVNLTTSDAFRWVPSIESMFRLNFN